MVMALYDSGMKMNMKQSYKGVSVLTPLLYVILYVMKNIVVER